MTKRRNVNRMDKSILLYSLVLLCGTFVSSISQVMLKKASQKQYSSLLKEYLNPLVFFAYVLFVGCTLLSVLAYKGIPLSMGPVLEATGYIYITIFGVKIFHEKISFAKIISLLLIVTGICIYAFCG